MTAGDSHFGEDAASVATNRFLSRIEDRWEGGETWWARSPRCVRGSAVLGLCMLSWLDVKLTLVWLAA